MSELEEASQQQDDLAQQGELLAILKRIDIGVSDHDDVIALAAALGLSKYFFH